jgi:hypothetical protein
MKIIGRVKAIRVRIYRRSPVDPRMKTYAKRMIAGTPIIRAMIAIGGMIYLIWDLKIRAGLLPP